MRLRHVQRTWDRLGQDTPMWAVLTGQEDWRQDDFFATGEEEIAGLLRYARSLRPGLRFGRALDFGCGIGRLTRALADRFDEVVGVDIAPSMIERARALHRDRANCSFVLNDVASLGLFDTGAFDLVYSNITLQHVPSRAASAYMREFVRVVDSEGLVVFQMASGPSAEADNGRLRLRAAARVVDALRSRVSPRMEMHGIERERVIQVLESAGARVVDVASDDRAGPGWDGYRYAAVVAGASP